MVAVMQMICSCRHHSAAAAVINLPKVVVAWYRKLQGVQKVRLCFRFPPPVEPAFSGIQPFWLCLLGTLEKARAILVRVFFPLLTATYLIAS